jgi:stress response protein SCP2
MFNEIRHPDESLFCEGDNINESNNMDDEKCHINVNNIDKTDQMMNLHNIHE